jgi:hypothetical protein
MNILHLCFRALDETFVTGSLSFFPALADVAPEWSGYNKFLKTIENTSNFFRNVVKEHEKTITEGEPRDYIDAYLEEIRSSKDEPSSSFSQSRGCKSSDSDVLRFLYIPGYCPHRCRVKNRKIRFRSVKRIVVCRVVSCRMQLNPALLSAFNIPRTKRLLKIFIQTLENLKSKTGA